MKNRGSDGEEKLSDSCFQHYRAIVLHAGGINSSRGLFRTHIMLVLVLRAQSCGLEGKDKPDKRI